jgi:ABC-type nitrate/sulfonate/bicarbonate transport system substrate-binding protein
MHQHSRWGMTALVAVLVACGPGGSERPAAPGSAPASAAAGVAPAPSGPGPGRSSAGPPEKIVYALGNASGVQIPPVVARHKGFFQEEGLEVELPIIPSNVAASGTATGEIDYNSQSSGSVRNALAGMPIRLVAVTVDKATRRIMAAPGIQTMEQLRGQTIAVNALGSGPHNSGTLAFEAFGIDPRTEITWVAVGTGGALFASVQQGVAQALVLSGGEIAVAESLGMGTVLRLDEVAPLPEAGVATGASKVETNPDQVRRVLRAVVRALQYVKSDREGSMPIFMEFLSLPRDQAEQAYDGVAFAFSEDGTLSERSMRYTVESEKRALDMTDEVATARVADFRPLYAMLAEQGIAPAPDRAR